MSSSKLLLTNHGFNLENYINKMHGNPYITELNESIKKQQINILKKNFPDECLDYLSIHSLMSLNSNFNDRNSLVNFYNNLNFDNSLSILEKISIVDKNLQALNNKQIYKINPTKLRISTMTMCGDLGTIIDTSNLYKNFIVPLNCLNTLNPTESNNKYNKDYIGIIGCKADDLEPKGYFNKKISKFL